MILKAMPIAGAVTVELALVEDERGSFARVWCRREFCDAGIDIDFVQCSISRTRLSGTLRGLHFQWPPSWESKLIRCQRGSIFDVLVDLRPDSRTYLSSCSVVLDEQCQSAVYCPPGVAHGFQTLTDDTEVHYMMADYYQPDLYGGIRYDDPAFGLQWPLPVRTILERDRRYADFERAAHEARFRAAALRCIASRV